MGIKVSIARDGVVSPGHIGITTYQNLAAVENPSGIWRTVNNELTKDKIV